MSEMTEQFDADLGAVVSELPTAFAWSSQHGSGAGAGVFTDLSKAGPNQIGGYVDEYDAVLHVRLSQFTGTAPNVGAQFVIGGKKMRCSRIVTSPDGVEIQFQLTAWDS